ncbi:MAG: hypothetical protein ACREIF_05580 [Chthoniobacterales bacterium]
MKTNMKKIGVVLLAAGLCIWSTQAFAQTTTTVATTKGAFTQYVPGSETVVVRSETNPNPVEYVVTKETTVVDGTGVPVALGRIPAGTPLSIQYTGSEDHLVASRIVVQRPVTTQETTTTTTTTRPLTHDEKHELKEAEERRRHDMKEQLERKKKAIEKAQDKLDDDH